MKLVLSGSHFYRLLNDDQVKLNEIRAGPQKVWSYAVFPAIPTLILPTSYKRGLQSSGEKHMKQWFPKSVAWKQAYPLISFFPWVFWKSLTPPTGPRGPPELSGACLNPLSLWCASHLKPTGLQHQAAFHRPADITREYIPLATRQPSWSQWTAPER